MFRFVLVTGILLTGCATIEYQYLGIEPLKNDAGHVVGQKERLRDAKTGEELERVTRYTPRLDSKGTVIGYEEATNRGTVLRDLAGRRVGLRYTDLRSRETNQNGEGVTVIVAP
jgi:hypothetical protein